MSGLNQARHAAAIAMLLLAAGCGAVYSPEAHRVDPDSARSTLEIVLESWKAGLEPGDWQEKSPPVVVQDMEWLSGAKLTSFEVLGTQPVDANLLCEVKLTLANDRQSELQRTVTYLVSTSPKLTVFRSPGI